MKIEVVLFHLKLSSQYNKNSSIQLTNKNIFFILYSKLNEITNC